MANEKEKYPLGFVMLMVLVVAIVLYNFSANQNKKKSPSISISDAEIQCVDSVMKRQLVRSEGQLQEYMENILSADGDFESYVTKEEKESLDEAVMFCSDMSKCISSERFIGLTECVERELSEYNSN